MIEALRRWNPFSKEVRERSRHIGELKRSISAKIREISKSWGPWGKQKVQISGVDKPLETKARIATRVFFLGPGEFFHFPNLATVLPEFSQIKLVQVSSIPPEARITLSSISGKITLRFIPILGMSRAEVQIVHPTKKTFHLEDELTRLKIIDEVIQKFS